MRTPRRALLPALLALGADAAFAAANDDAAILVKLIRLEQGGAVGPFRDQAQAHIRDLTAALKDLGGTPPKPFVGRAPGNRHERLEFEITTVAAYRDATRRLEKSELLKTAAEIMANHGQRLVVLRQALGREPVPAAFEPL